MNKVATLIMFVNSQMEAGQHDFLARFVCSSQHSENTSIYPVKNVRY